MTAGAIFVTGAHLSRSEEISLLSSTDVDACDADYGGFAAPVRIQHDPLRSV